MNAAWGETVSIQCQVKGRFETTVSSHSSRPLSLSCQVAPKGSSDSTHPRGVYLSWPTTPLDTRTLPSGSLVLSPPAGLQAGSPSGSAVGRWRAADVPWPHGAKGKPCTWGKTQAVSGPCCVHGTLPLLGAVLHLLSPQVGRVLPPLFHLLRAVGATSLLSQGSPRASAGRAGERSSWGRPGQNHRRFLSNLASRTRKGGLSHVPGVSVSV